MTDPKVYDPTKCEWHGDKIDDLEKAIFGNSQAGLIRDVASIKVYVKIILAILVPILATLVGTLIHALGGG